MTLHKTRIKHRILRRDDTHTARRLLHDNRQDEASIHATRSSDLLDRGLHFGNLGVGVVGYAPLCAGVFHVWLVGREPGMDCQLWSLWFWSGGWGVLHGVEVYPLALGWPACCY